MNTNTDTISSQLTRYELDAKCQAIESKMDARIKYIEELTGELKKEFRGAKWWAIGAVLTVLATFAGILQLTNSWRQTTISLIGSNVDSISTKLDSLVVKVDSLAATKK